MQAVYGIYDGKVVRLLEPIQVENPYRVTVTFLEPIRAEGLAKDTSTADEDNLERFIGMWADFTPEEDRVFKTILEERASYFAGREIESGKSTELQPEFAASLRQSLEQARSGEGIDLKTFREQIGR